MTHAAVRAAAMAAALLMGLNVSASGTRPTPPPEDDDLVAVRDGFSARAAATLSRLAGKPLTRVEKQPPLGRGRPAYVRGYGYSLSTHALKTLLLGEDPASANEALSEYAEYFLTHPAERRDKDNFYWSSDIAYRCVEFFGSHGSIEPRLITQQTEDLLLDLAWAFCKETSARRDADLSVSRTWCVYESENHDLQRFSTVWQLSKLLKDEPRYRDRPYDDGGLPAEHHRAWTRYAIDYLRERARKGLFVEVSSPGYALQSLKGIHAFHDFSEDPDLGRAAGMFLDLFWANWAQEQIDGVRGGGKTRCYQGNGSQTGMDTTSRMAWFHFGLGEPRGTGNLLSVITSDYRVPLVVIDLALDPVDRGNYEIVQRRMGLAEPGFYQPPDYRLRQDFGGILKYSYCTPDFVMGALMCEARPLSDWTMISSQNRWHGVVFRGAPDARLYVQCRDGVPSKTYNQQWSVQSKGTLIAQRLAAEGQSQTPDALRIWFSRPGLGDRVERDGWVFSQAPGAYVAVLAVEGTTRWRPSATGAPGEWLCCDDSLTPVILEASPKREHRDYRAFQDAVIESRPVHSGGVLTYDALGGDRLTFYTDYRRPPMINNETVEYAPANVFDSPFVKSLWNSGVIEIQKGKRRLVLDFNDISVHESLL
ncbi:hypothetical protein [Botrimarina sp.]|uniref:hypothetical protein n=1 Tax=Botrimarina sp. TaxID=2795802 RepID=UPI0032EDB73B